MNLLDTSGGRRLLFFLLYLCEGAPIGFVWGTLPVVLSRRGDADADVAAMLGLVVLPWSLKVLVAPLVDVLQRREFTLRAWIVLAQLGMAGALVPLATGDLAPLPALTTLLVAHAMAAAVQDVAIDNLAIRTTTVAERGKVTAAMQAGLMTGRVLFGALALLASARIGLRAVVVGLLCLLLLGALLACVYRAPAPAPTGSALRTFARALGGIVTTPRTWLALLFAGVGGAAYEATGGLARTLLASRGMSPDAIALQFALPTLGLLAAGAWIGGPLADRFGRTRAVAIASCCVSLAVLGVARAAASADDTTLVLALFAVYLGIGMFTASSYALFMDLCDPRVAATQFSAFMGATNLCEGWSIALCGAWAAEAGYPTAFAGFAGIGLLGLVVLWALHPPFRGTQHRA